MFLVGVCGFGFLVAPRVRGPEGAAWRDGLERRLARAGAMVAGALLAVGAWRLWAETNAIFGPDEGVTWQGARTVATTGWGSVWLLQMSAATTLAALLPSVGRLGRPAWWAGGAITLVLAASLALTGHSMDGADWGLRVALQAVHVLGAGLWAGTLLVLLAFGLRPSSAEAPPGPGIVVNAFSPVALAGVGVLALSGVVTALVYLDQWSQLWATWYGRTLLLKLLLFAGAAAFGAYNWRRLRPRLERGGDPAALPVLRRSAAVELVLAGLVLAVTAILVALPMELD